MWMRCVPRHVGYRGRAIESQLVDFLSNHCELVICTSLF